MRCVSEIKRQKAKGKNPEWRCACDALLLMVLAVAGGIGFGQEVDPAHGAAPPGSYVLGPDDQIVIRALDAEEISDKPVLIGTNGNISLPLIGRVQAAGLTVEEIELELGNRLKKYLREPQVSVTVVEFRSQPVSVLGAVSNPGVRQLRGRKTLFEVLSEAGLRNDAGTSVRITRKIEHGPLPLEGAVNDPTGQFSVAEVGLREILEARNPVLNIEVKPHDTVLVSQANANMIYVVGEVVRSGAFTFGQQERVSVLSAVSLAGGLGRTSKPEKAKILREAADSPKRIEIAVNIKRMMLGEDEDLLMRPNDVLVVPSSSRKAFTTYVLPATVAAAVAAVIYAGVR
jgi:polysaccharide export outer membrane protein